MHIFDAVQSAITSVLVFYLSLTGSFANYVLNIIEPNNKTAPAPLASNTPTPASTELTLLSKIYAQGNTISRVLFENEAFQKAAEESKNQASLVTALTPEEPTDESVLHAIVNILCEYKTDDYIRTTTGTGFFIDDRGVLMTNAHVAQFLLLESVDTRVRDVSCVVRSGNPATPTYTAELLFISPTWIFNNASLISVAQPRGTGEYDYALLYIDGMVDNSPLPATFPALPIHTAFLSKQLAGSAVVTAGYPAVKLLREGARAALTPEIATTTITELYTFGSNYADIFSISSSPVGEQGASGGPVVRKGQGALGLIVTKGDAVTEGAQSLRALTLSYIDRTIIEETGYTLLDNATGDFEYRGSIFKEALAPHLAELLAREIE